MERKVNVTVNEILDALAAGTIHDTADQPDVHTGAEVRKAMGWSGGRFGSEMRLLLLARRVTVTRVFRPAIDGSLRNVPGYRFLR